MKTFSLPALKSNLTLLFDMDGTLYTNNDYMKSQIDLPITRLAEIQGKTFERMKTEITVFQKNWADTHNGKTISLANTFKFFGITIEESISWREELCRPQDYLSNDKTLHAVLRKLSSSYSLAVVTNNPVSVAVNTLSVLGVNDIFTKIIGLDTCGVSKPHEDVYKKVLNCCGVGADQCISIGDRYDIDIAFPLELGMGGILVDGVEDVYRLPELLL